MADNRMTITIDANDRSATSAIRRVGTEFGNLERLALQAALRIQNAFNNMARDLQRALQSVQGSFSGLQSQSRLVDQYGRPASSTYTPLVPTVPVAFSQRFTPELGRAAAAFANGKFTPVSEAGKKLQQLERLHAPEQALKPYKDQLDKATAANKALEQSQNSVTKSMAGQMVTGIALFKAMEGGIGIIKGLTVESGKLAAQAESYQLAMHAVAQSNGVAASTTDNLEKKLKQLGITTIASRQAITLATSSGMDLSKLPGQGGLARLSQNLAVMKPEMTSSQVFNNTLYGIQSGQTDVLRTVGLNVSFENAYKEFARAAKRTTDSLSEQEKMQIRLNAVLKESPKYQGMYEQSLGSVGKQTQSLRRVAEEAKIAIGEYFIPAMELVVSTATWALTKIQQNPAVGKFAAIGGATAAGAATGAALGSIIPGLGTGIGALVGGGLAALGTTGSILYSDNRRASRSAMDMFWDDRMKKAKEQEAQERASQISRDREEEKRQREAENAAKVGLELANRRRQAERDALNDLRQARVAELDDVQKIVTQYSIKLEQLREEKLLTKEIQNIRFQELQQNIANLNKRDNDKIAEEWKTRNTDANQTRFGQMFDSFSANADSLQSRNDLLVRGHVEAFERRKSIQEQEMVNFRSHLDRQRELELNSLNEVAAVTVPQKLALEQQKLNIELDYIQKQRDADLRLLAFKAELAKREVAIRYAGHQELIKSLQTLIDLEQNAAEKSLTAAASDQSKNARLQSVKNQYGVIYDANRKLFDQLKHSADGIFDSMLSKSQSVWKSMANSFKMAFLTVFKEIVTSQIARSLTGMLTGQNVGLAPGGGNMTGRFGRFASVLGGLGLGSVPIFGAGSITGGPGGTGGFAGPVMNQSLQVPGWVYGVGKAPQSGGFGNFMGAGTGILGTKSAQGIFGKAGMFGKNGGAVQGGLLLGGSMLAMDGWSRGGWGGALEMAGGGAAIGMAVGGPIGAAIGAGIGGGIGVLRALFKSDPTKEMKKRVQAITGVRIDQKSTLKSMVEQWKASGAKIDDYIKSRPAQDLIEMYAMSTNQKFRNPFNMGQLNMALSGGSLYELPSFVNGAISSPVSSLDMISGSAASSGTGNITLQLDPQATKDVLEGRAASVIENNPRLVAKSNSKAVSQNYGRFEMSSALAPTAIRG